MSPIPTILFSQRTLHDPTNPYSRLLFESFGNEARILRFSWKNALFIKFDIFHLQWPEYVFRENRLHLRVLNYLLCHLLLAKLRMFRIPVIETVHNLRPHDRTAWLERKPLASLRRQVCHRIYLNRSSENNISEGSVILHGHYRSVLNGMDAQKIRDSPYFLFFGLLRPYKGMEKLISAYRAYGGPVGQLVIAGLPVDPAYGESLTRIAEGDARIVLDLRHVPDEELAALVANAVAVVLPYEYMYNSGALIYALSASTHVLAPASPANEAIQGEVGSGWVITFEESIRAEDFDRVAAARRNCPSDSPDLSERDWEGVATRHLALYRDLLA